MAEYLDHIYMTSGVNTDDEGFVTIAAHGTEGTILVGQLSPSDIRKHALGYLETAEAAEQDAAVMRLIKQLGLPEELAGAIITELRKSRNDGEG